MPRVPDVFSSSDHACRLPCGELRSRPGLLAKRRLPAILVAGEVRARRTRPTDFDHGLVGFRLPRLQRSRRHGPADFEFGTTGHIESLYQEVRLSHETDALAWSLGGNFRKDRTYDFQATDVSRGTNTFVAGLKLNTVDIYSDQHVETHAVFADGELRLSPRWSLVAGVRYTRDKRDFSGSTCDDGDGETSAVYTALSNTFRTRFGLPELAPIAPGECVTLSPDTFTPKGVVSDSLDEDNIAFRGQVNVKPTDHSLLYASFSRGFKAGSFPTVATVFSAGYGPAKQERVDALELGFNATLFERRARLQGAAFHYDYDDKQLRGRILDPVIGNLAKLVNVPRAEMGGFELDLAISPVPGLTLQTAVAYLHTEVKEFTGVNLFGQTEDFAGQTLPYSPPWSVNAGGQYEWRVFDGNKAFASADYAYRSRTSGFIGRDRPVDIRAWATLDLRAGIRFRDDRWKIEIWGHNVTDTDYVTSAMRNGDTVNAYAARPATYGLSVGFETLELTDRTLRRSSIFFHRSTGQPEAGHRDDQQDRRQQQCEAHGLGAEALTQCIVGHAGDKRHDRSTEQRAHQKHQRRHRSANVWRRQRGVEGHRHGMVSTGKQRKAHGTHLRGAERGHQARGEDQRNRLSAADGMQCK